MVVNAVASFITLLLTSLEQKLDKSHFYKKIHTSIVAKKLTNFSSECVKRSVLNGTTIFLKSMDKNNVSKGTVC